MTTLTVPEAWTTVLDRVRAVLPSAFLAGGALRDLDNGRPVKDLDVFFTEEAYDLTYLEDSLAKLDYFYRSSCSAKYMKDAANEVGGTKTYWHCPHYSNADILPELNLIQLEPSFNPASIIDRVDFGLCQIGADARGVIKTAAYDYDKANQGFTLTRADTVEGVVRSIKRHKRLTEKYQGWSLMWKAEFDGLVMEAYKRIAADNAVYTVAETF
jgi:hypothetical protein